MRFGGRLFNKRKEGLSPLGSLRYRDDDKPLRVETFTKFNDGFERTFLKKGNAVNDDFVGGHFHFPV